MADPRFYDNRGPIALLDLCRRIGVELPPGADGSRPIRDVASLEGAGADHLAFASGKKAAKALARSRAGFCFVDDDELVARAPSGTIAVRCPNASQAFATAAAIFYPDHAAAVWQQTSPVDSSARIGQQVHLAPGAVVGPGAELGDGTQIGPNAVIGRGVCIGQDCVIGPNVTISHSYIGDGVAILPGAQIGQPGFGFASGARGHQKIPQLGRVIVQDRVEIGACSTIDRGALGDTVIGEGTKIDNLVQIGHNCRIGRHCIIVALAGLSGSCDVGDFVVLGGQVGLADHTTIGDGARLAARSGALGTLAGGQDYGGVPAVPMREWRRQVAAIAMLGRRPKRDKDG